MDAGFPDRDRNKIGAKAHNLVECTAEWSPTVIKMTVSRKGGQHLKCRDKRLMEEGTGITPHKVQFLASELRPPGEQEHICHDLKPTRKSRDHDDACESMCER